MEAVQMYGERCSGTSYPEQLLKTNLRILIANNPFGWKHGFPGPGVEAPGYCLFVVIHRHPYDWIPRLNRKSVMTLTAPTPDRREFTLR